MLSLRQALIVAMEEKDMASVRLYGEAQRNIIGVVTRLVRETGRCIGHIRRLAKKKDDAR